MRFERAQKLSPHQALTSEGFLVCTGCALARTGGRVYMADEMPGIKPGKDGFVTVYRDSKVLFDKDSMASLEGKAVTLGHPPVDVTVENFKKYAVGAIHNVRQGQGEQQDSLVADLVITDPKAIKAIQGGTRELSLGYTCDIDTSDGLAVETALHGNHVAIVPKGRCGAFCSIEDELTTDRGQMMADTNTEKEKKDPNAAALDGISKQLAALTERLAKLEAAQKNGKEPTATKGEQETSTDACKKKDAADNAPDLAQMVQDAVKAALATEKVTKEIARDAAIVAPTLAAGSVDALGALQEFAKDAQQAKMLDAWGGIAAINKDNAPAILTAVAGLVKARAADKQAQGAKAQDQQKQPSFFEQAAALWKKD